MGLKPIDIDAMDIDIGDSYPSESVDRSTSITLLGTMKQPRLTPASDTGSGSATDAKARSRIRRSTGSATNAKAWSRFRRSTYYSKVELPVLSASGATTQRPILNGAAGDSAQERLSNNASVCSIEGLDDREFGDAEEVEDSMVVKKWHELGTAPAASAAPGSDPESDSEPEITLPWGEISSSRYNPAPEAGSVPLWSDNDPAESCAQESHGNNFPVCNDEKLDDHEVRWSDGTRVNQLQDQDVLEKKIQAMRCTANPEGPTMQATQLCPSAFFSFNFLVDGLLNELWHRITGLKSFSKAGAHRYLNYLEGAIEMLRDGVQRFNDSTLDNCKHYYILRFLPNPILWAFLIIGPLVLVGICIKDILGDVRVCFTTPTHDRQDNKDQEHVNSPEDKYEPNEEHLLPVTRRAVSKLIRVDGQSDITLRELLVFDKLESQGGLGRKTIRILDGIRDVVLEDVMGKLEARRMFFRNKLRAMSGNNLETPTLGMYWCTCIWDSGRVYLTTKTMGRTHPSNSDQTTPGPISITEKRYRRPPWPDPNSSITMGARLTPDIGSESEHDMDGELELPRPLDNAETTIRGRQPYGARGGMDTAAEGSSEELEASNINEAFARRREERSYLTEKVQNMRPRACRHPQPRIRRGVRARVQGDEVGVADKHARESGDEPNARHRTVKEAFDLILKFICQANMSHDTLEISAVAIGGGFVLLSPILVIGIGFICVMKVTIFLANLGIFGVTQICNHFAVRIEIILERVYFTLTTLINFWDFINLPSAFLWGLFMGISLFLVVNLEVFRGGMRTFMEEAIVSGREKQKREAREQFCNRPVTSRAVSKLVSLGRNDITLADLVMLDEMQSEGGLNPRTVQILDGIRKAVLEDVEGEATGKEEFIEE
ncbi:hypothetical protein L211DRAFT_845284 [Terfezia boudieri ATCC MYA-4762]|uniref:Uncharacterized protein n=1 Tax=Terfezia boudieri ATCC MYA-4762 TaxID=1051890 RepID=A0A3N4M2P8_9PEZI|nr:hypothetical protein L211DRAFT_845284 [Terfezia boudieri ATCC MYA-4762]